MINDYLIELTHECGRYGGKEQFLASDRHPMLTILHLTEQILQLNMGLLGS